MALKSLTGGGGPLDSVSSLTGGDGPLGAASSLTSGGGPLDTVSGLTSNGPLDAVGGLTGGEGGPLDAVSGLAGGLLGGSQGLNLVNLVGVGSDEDALVDLNPAEKKKVKAAKAAAAKQNEMKRKKAMADLQKQVQAQGGKPTPQQEELARQLNASQVADDEAMAKYDKILGPTDPELYEQAMSGEAGASGPSQGLYYAYLVDSRTCQPTHILTFPNAAAASQWYAIAAKSSSVEKAGDQMYMYTGAVPRPVGKMAQMPISQVQPIIPLQRGDGYPICCKSGGSSGAASSMPAAQPKPARKKLTFQDAAEAYANSAQQKGDPRSKEEIMNEAIQDLKANCPQVDEKQYSTAASQPQSSSPLGGLTNGVTGSDGPVGGLTKGPLGGLTNGVTGGDGPVGGLTKGPLGGLTGGASPLGGLTDAAGGDLLSGLLGGSQGLNVLGLAAIGSDEKALLDLAPAEKKEARLQKAKELQRQRQIQDQQMEALREQIKKNNGRQTAEQQKQVEELKARREALKKATSDLEEAQKKDDEAEAAKSKASGATDALSAVPTNGVTDDLANKDITKSVPLPSF